MFRRAGLEEERRIGPVRLVLEHRDVGRGEPDGPPGEAGQTDGVHRTA
jgi:hypothetical protein